MFIVPRPLAADRLGCHIHCLTYEIHKTSLDMQYGIAVKTLTNRLVGTGFASTIEPRKGRVRCNSVVRAFAHGAMGRRIDPSWGWIH